VSAPCGRGVLRIEEETMFNFGDLFQWDRFITPSIIKIFYWLAVALVALFGLSGLFSAVSLLPVSPIGGLIAALASVAAEFILIVFRINEHLGAIRNRGET
jgi:cytochrome b subunit of formate dehydrogenase